MPKNHLKLSQILLKWYKMAELWGVISAIFCIFSWCWLKNCLVLHRNLRQEVGFDRRQVFTTRVRDNIFLLQRNFKNRIKKYQVLVGKWHVWYLPDTEKPPKIRCRLMGDDFTAVFVVFVVVLYIIDMQCVTWICSFSLYLQNVKNRANCLQNSLFCLAAKSILRH